jgi:hypothetical protein
VLRRSNSRGSPFNADDCKEKEEEDHDRAQDGCEEAGAQGREEEDRSQDEAESKKVVSLTVCGRQAASLLATLDLEGVPGWQRQRPRFLLTGGRGLLFYGFCFLEIMPRLLH